jgi:hypothetical protein
MTRIAPMADSGTATAAADGAIRVAKSCGVTDGELVLTAREVDVVGTGEDVLVLNGSDFAEVDGCGLVEDE